MMAKTYKTKGNQKLIFKLTLLNPWKRSGIKVLTIPQKNGITSMYNIATVSNFNPV
jgi:hypothetical protein